MWTVERSASAACWFHEVYDGWSGFQRWIIFGFWDARLYAFMIWGFGAWGLKVWGDRV